MPEKYFGKYRGLVVDNCDPENRGRIQVIVPSLLKDVKIWALPCAPYAGLNVGLVLIPPIGANVWVEFEEGDIDSPIYSGGFWEANEFPVEAHKKPDIKLLKMNKITLILNDKAEESGISLQVVTQEVPLNINVNKEGISFNYNKNQATIRLTNNGISIVNGNQSIKITNSEVSINEDHLRVI